MVEYGIQRNSIYLTPPTKDDLKYMFKSFNAEEVWGMFGWDGPSEKEIKKRHKKNNLIVGMIRRVSSGARIGFTIGFPPPRMLDNYYEFAAVIVERSDRDAFSMISSADAFAHYVFDHLQQPAIVWRVRADNRAANAIARRMRYPASARIVSGNHRFIIYRVTTAIWEKRRASLDAAVSKAKVSAGSTFVTLLDPPYEPVPLT